VVSGVLPKFFFWFSFHLCLALCMRDVMRGVWCATKDIFLFSFDLYLALYAPKCSKIHVLAIRDSFRGDVHKLGWYIYKFDKQPHPTGI
jgi:hypothetical protein